MKVGLLGAPGAGKSTLARRLKRTLNEGDWKVIDKYVDRLSDRTDLAYRYFATYEQNLQIAFERWTLEQEVRATGFNSITCGTLYETALYCAIKTHRWTDDPMVRAEEALRAETTMRTIGMMEVDLFDYDLLFWIPYSEKTLQREDIGWDLVVDRKIPDVLDGYFRNAIVLNKTEKENAKNAADIIRRTLSEIESSQAPSQASSNEQQTV